MGVRMDDVNGVADIVMRLDRSREEIKRKAKAAASFAKEHDCERTCRIRIVHLKEIGISAETRRSGNALP
jgi:hypothetical protein